MTLSLNLSLVGSELCRSLNRSFFSSLIFWEVLSFGILFFVLYKFAFPGILGVLEEREKKIKDSLDQAERHRSEAERTFKDV